MVKENGYMYASNAEISGTINATSGSIGGLEIDGSSLRATSNFAIKIGNEPVFQINEEGRLEFKGVITAEGGEIGGFKIENELLISTDAEESVSLNGKSGSITANKIYIGTGAEITEYIKLGNAYIRNPTAERNEENCFIDADKTKIYEDGRIKVGEIEINGEESRISGAKFSITPEEAIFSNVRVSGEIETAVFKINTV